MSILGWLGGRTIDRTLNGTNQALHSSFRYPESHEEWVERYNWLWSGYVGDPYQVSAIKALGLFRALDASDKVIAETRRLTRDIAHVVDTDARAMANGVQLVNAVESPAARQMEETGRAILARSKARRVMGAWARCAAGLGDVGIEVARTNATRPFSTKLVGHDPRCFEAVYDATGTVLERVIIKADRFDGPDVDGMGNIVHADRLGTYRKVLNAESVTVYRDGRLSESESGAHGLGVVPFVHFPFTPTIADPGHGIWAAQGLDMALAMMDSLLTQVQAIGNRHGNPHLVAVGVRFGSGGDEMKLGRVISGVPQGGSVQYTEAQLTGVSVLLDAIATAREQARATLPEFLFSQAGASASGSALNFWAAAFVGKMEEVRGRWFASLIDAVEMAEAMDRGARWDPSGLIAFNAPPVLPVNASTELDMVVKAKEQGGLKRIDFVRHLQRIGVVPADADPAEYAEEVRVEQSAEDERLFAIANAGTGAPVVNVG